MKGSPLPYIPPPLARKMRQRGFNLPRTRLDGSATVCAEINFHNYIFKKCLHNCELCPFLASLKTGKLKGNQEERGKKENKKFTNFYALMTHFTGKFNFSQIWFIPLQRYSVLLYCFRCLTVSEASCIEDLLTLFMVGRKPPTLGKL